MQLAIDHFLSRDYECKDVTLEFKNVREFKQYVFESRRDLTTISYLRRIKETKKIFHVYLIHVMNNKIDHVFIYNGRIFSSKSYFEGDIRILYSELNELIQPFYTCSQCDNMFESYSNMYFCDSCIYSLCNECIIRCPTNHRRETICHKCFKRNTYYSVDQEGKQAIYYNPNLLMKVYKDNIAELFEYIKKKGYELKNITGLVENRIKTNRYIISSFLTPKVVNFFKINSRNIKFFNKDHLLKMASNLGGRIEYIIVYNNLNVYVPENYDNNRCDVKKSVDNLLEFKYECAECNTQYNKINNCENCLYLICDSCLLTKYNVISCPHCEKENTFFVINKGKKHKFTLGINDMIKQKINDLSCAKFVSNAMKICEREDTETDTKADKAIKISELIKEALKNKL